MNLYLQYLRKNNISLKISNIEKVFPSETNFILIKLKDAASVQKLLAKEGVIIRDRSNQPKLQNCLRITVGTREQNEQLLHSLHKVLNKTKSL